MRKLVALLGFLALLAFAPAALGDETLTLDTYNPGTTGYAGPVQTTEPLQPNWFYLVTVQGTFSLFPAHDWLLQTPTCGSPESAPMFPSPNTSATGPVGADAETVFAAPFRTYWCPSSITLPTPNEKLQIDTGLGFVHVAPEGGPYTSPTANHSYTYVLQGYGTTANFAFRFKDHPTSDNYGALQITVHRATSDDCKKGGWMQFGVFKNQGDCVSFFATDGSNPADGYE